jgi:streptogramin lyase
MALVLAAGGTLFALRAFRGVRPAPRPADQPRIVETASIGARPQALAVTYDAVWVVSSADRMLRRLDPASGELVDEIPLPDGLGPPSAVVEEGGSIWVQTGFASGPPEITPAVVRIDPANGAPTTLPLDRGEHGGIAIGADALWSVNSETGVVSRHDLSTGKVTATVQGPASPVELAFGRGAVWSLGRGRGDVTPPVPGTLTRIDPASASVIGSTEVGVGPSDLAVGESAVWIANPSERSVLRIDPETVSVTDEIPVPGIPSQIAVGGTGVWVLDTAGRILFRMDPTTTLLDGSVRVGPAAVAVAVGRDSVWVARADGAILRLEA